MRFASLGSGSKGNSTLVEYKQTCIMIDCGFGLNDSIKRLARLDKSPEDISAILVTHEHGDHFGNAVSSLSRQFKIPVYMTHGTWEAKKRKRITRLEFLNPHQSLLIGDLKVQPVAVPHDAREPCQYILESDANKFGILTDLGHITPFVIDQYQDCSALVLESNHDVEMLMDGPYPQMLKQRIAGDLGHLSNEQALHFLHHANLDRLKHLVLAHLSEQNNNPAQVIDLIAAKLVSKSEALCHLISQDDGLGWCSL